MRELKVVAAEHEVPLIQNTRNGHCANMDVVFGGFTQTRISPSKHPKAAEYEDLESRKKSDSWKEILNKTEDRSKIRSKDDAAITR